MRVLLVAAGHTDAALVVATHDAVVAEQLSERWEIHDGQLKADAGAWSR